MAQRVRVLEQAEITKLERELEQGQAEADDLELELMGLREQEMDLTRG